MDGLARIARRPGYGYGAGLGRRAGTGTGTGTSRRTHGREAGNLDGDSVGEVMLDGPVANGERTRETAGRDTRRVRKRKCKPTVSSLEVHGTLFPPVQQINKKKRCSTLRPLPARVGRPQRHPSIIMGSMHATAAVPGQRWSSHLRMPTLNGRPYALPIHGHVHTSSA